MTPAPAIREDLFDGESSLFTPMPEYREKRIQDCQKALPAQFPTRDDVVNYVNSLSSKETAKLFCEMGLFYRVSKENVSVEVLQFIMILTIIERLQLGGKKFLAPWDYLSQRQSMESLLGTAPAADIDGLMKLLAAAKEKYFANYGATRGVVDFFQNYASEEDKILLAQSLKFGDTEYIPGNVLFDTRVEKAATKADVMALGYTFERGSLPLCYFWKKCYIEYGKCYPPQGCELKTDAGKMADTIKKLVQLLYSWRSKFDHEGEIPPISDTTFITAIEGKVIVNDLTIDMFRGIFERAYKAYFDRHVLPPAATAAPPTP